MLVLVDTCVRGPCRAAAAAPGSSAVGGKGSEPGSLTGQKAEPVGMKLTLFLSGQEKSGTEAEADCLELSSKALTFSQPSGGSLLNMYVLLGLGEDANLGKGELLPLSLSLS